MTSKEDRQRRQCWKYLQKLDAFGHQPLAPPRVRRRTLWRLDKETMDPARQTHDWHARCGRAGSALQLGETRLWLQTGLRRSRRLERTRSCLRLLASSRLSLARQALPEQRAGPKAPRHWGKKRCASVALTNSNWRPQGRVSTHPPPSVSAIFEASSTEYMQPHRPASPSAAPASVECEAFSDNCTNRRPLAKLFIDHLSNRSTMTRGQQRALVQAYQ